MKKNASTLACLRLRRSCPLLVLGLLSAAMDCDIASAAQGPQVDTMPGYTATALSKRAVDAQVTANVGYFGQGQVPPTVIASVASDDLRYAESLKAPAQTAPAGSLSPMETELKSTAPYALVAGEPIEAQLFAWAKRAGWKVLWNLPDDNNWIVPGDRDCGTDFEAAVQDVVQTLSNNGVDIVGDSWRGNKTIVISQSGATDQ